jgi:hypothetical protein
MLDQFASTVADAITTSNASMARLEESQARFAQELADFKQTIQDDHEQGNAERQALARVMLQMVATRQADAERMQQVEAALVKLSEVSEGITALLAKSVESHPTVLAKLTLIESKVNQILESQS